MPGWLPSWEIIGPLLIAVAAVITAVGSLTKVLAEVRAMRLEQNQIREQVQNSHGTNLRADLDVIRDEMRDGLGQVRKDLAEVRDNSHRHDKELSRLADGQLATTRAVMDGLDRLSDADAEDRKRADAEHLRLWQALRARMHNYPPQEEDS